MYDSLVKRLTGYDGWGLLGLFFGQCLMVLAGPALIILGLIVWNPLLVLGGLLSLRLLFFCCDLQMAVLNAMAASEEARSRRPLPRDPL